jgi:hypothetical protein
VHLNTQFASFTGDKSGGLVHAKAGLLKSWEGAVGEIKVSENFASIQWDSPNTGEGSLYNRDGTQLMTSPGPVVFFVSANFAVSHASQLGRIFHKDKGEIAQVPPTTEYKFTDDLLTVIQSPQFIWTLDKDGAVKVIRNDLM